MKNQLILPNGETVSLNGEPDEKQPYTPKDEGRTMTVLCHVRPDLMDMLDVLGDFFEREPEEICDDLLEANIALMVQQVVDRIQQERDADDREPWDEPQLPFGD